MMPNAKRLMRDVAEGVVASAVATSAMTVFMEAWARVQQPPEPIPPRIVAQTIAGRLDIWRLMRGPLRDAYVWASHFGYGASMALVYRAAETRVPASAALKGAAYGLAVWIASYAGWLPGLGLLRPPSQKPPARVALLVGAHLVYGVTLGLGTTLVRRPARLRPGTSDVRRVVPGAHPHRAAS